MNWNHEALWFLATFILASLGLAAVVSSVIFGLHKLFQWLY